MEQQEYLRKVKRAGFNRVEMMSTKEFHLDGEGRKPPTKLLSITVRACK